MPGLRPIPETFQRKAAALRKLPRLAGNVDRLLRSVRFNAKVHDRRLETDNPIPVPEERGDVDPSL